MLQHVNAFLEEKKAKNEEFGKKEENIFQSIPKILT